MTQHATPGQNARDVFTAEKHNRWQRTADNVLGGLVNQSSSIGDSKARPGVVQVRNQSGGDLSAFSVLALGAPIISDSENLEAFKARPRFDGTTPTTGDEGRFCVILTDAPSGAIVDAVASGVVPCLVQVDDTNHRFAGIYSGDATQLQSGTEGGAQILNAPTSTGQQWRLVRLSNADAAEIDPYYDATGDPMAGLCGLSLNSKMQVSWIGDNGDSGNAVCEFYDITGGVYRWRAQFSASADYGTHEIGSGGSGTMTVKEVLLTHGPLPCDTGTWSINLYGYDFFTLGGGGATATMPGPVASTAPEFSFDYTTVHDYTYTVGILDSTSPVKWRGGYTAAEWETVNPVLRNGDAGLETDTGKFKVGDGSTAWNSLSYNTASASVAAADITDATADGIALITSADANPFTDADETKLDGIETGATADQTGAEIKTAYEAEADTNAFTDADHSKLDGIEAGATADQTGAEIKTAYEGEANTNAFTDAEQTKLSGIETGADVTDTANVTAAGALMDSEVTNLAQVKAFDSSDYATAAQGTLADSALQNINSENLTDLSDVDTDKSKTPADGDVLTFDGTDWNAEAPDAASFTITAKTSAYTASPLDFVIADVETTGSFTVNLPSSPSAGDKPIAVKLGTRTTHGRAVTIGRNGNTIEGSASDLVINVEGWITVLQYDGSTWQIVGKHWPPTYIQIEDQKSDGSDAGTFTSGAWRTRELNTEVTDTGNNVSLASNTMTLDPGTYEFYARAPSYNVDYHRLRFYNSSDSTEIKLGQQTYEPFYSDFAIVYSRFTITAQKDITLEHRCTVTQNTFGLGYDDTMSLGVEIMAQVIGRKVA